VVVAGARAATPITIAGLVLAASFALLVPAVITLVGERSGWPGHRLGPGAPR